MKRIERIASAHLGAPEKSLNIMRGQKKNKRDEVCKVVGMKKRIAEIVRAPAAGKFGPRTATAVRYNWCRWVKHPMEIGKGRGAYTRR